MMVLPPDSRLVLAQLSVNTAGSDDVITVDSCCVHRLLVATAMSYDGKVATDVTVSVTSSGVMSGGCMLTFTRSGREPQFAGPPTKLQVTGAGPHTVRARPSTGDCEVML